MFRLHTSNDAAKLAAALGEQLCGPRGNPLIPARVLVPQAGLRRWLQVNLAERYGVIANVDFTPPAQFAWELLRAASPGLPQPSPFDVDVLRWHLYGLLGARLDGIALEPLRAYLKTDNDPLRRYALSFELARVYERMQGYRRNKLLRWEHSGSSEADDAGNWQAELWRRLLPRVGGMSRAGRVDAWLRAYDPEYPSDSYAEKPAPPGLPAHLSCFACANVSPDVLRMLAVAGLHCDVDFFLPLPSNEYLGDTPRSRKQVRSLLADKNNGNPLIVSLGGAAAEFIELLYGYEHVLPGDETDAFDEAIPRTTLLGRVRDDILNHVAPRADDLQPLPDDSLQFRACHTPLREVQTLHDALLAMFEDNATLQPRDVAVMMPDVTAYRPAIEAVFGGVARNDARFLPYNLGDTGASVLHPVAQLFLDLLDAPISRWEVNEILDVLAAPGVMRRFDLDADALERLSRRVRDAGVRWGEDEHARANCGGYREFSWAFGIDRMLAGFACGDGDDEEALVGGTAPLDGVEGAAFAHLDAVLAMTETWRRLRELSQHARTASDWQRVLNEVLDSLYQPDPRDLAETGALERIRAALEKLADDCGHTDTKLELPWPDVRAFLRDQLAHPDAQQYLFTGGVTFCGMVPLRVVPFRVICLLGMDEAAFPRREASGLDPLLADRRAGKPERGDRDVRADDRLLFLQLLAAAHERFYVSWIGRDPRTNEDRPPSMVVSELLDMLREHYLLPPTDDDERDRQRQSLPRIEPPHPFAASLFDANGGRPRSYQREWLPAARTPTHSSGDIPPFAPRPLPPPATVPSTLDLADLQRFFDDPARGFLEHALQLRLPRNADEDADLEPLQPDHPLLRYGLATALLASDDAEVATQAALLRAQGRLPPGELADVALAIARGRADLLREAITAFTHGEPRGNDITSTLALPDGTQLAGTVADVYRTGLVRCSPGGFRGRRVLRAWLDILFLTLATEMPRTCRFLWIARSQGSDKVEARNIAVSGADEAREAMTRLLAAYREGLRQPLPLFPDASALGFKLERQAGPRAAEEDRIDFIDALAAIASKVDEDGEFSNASDFDKPSVRLAWRGIDMGRNDPALAVRLHAAACALFPRLHPLPKGQA